MPGLTGLSAASRGIYAGVAPLASTQFRVLIVEDHVAFRNVVARFVRSIVPHASVITHGDASGALTLCANARPHVVLMDVELPSGDGLVLARDIKERFPDVAVIVLTSHDSGFLRNRAATAGADYYVQKEHAFDRLPALLVASAARSSGNDLSNIPDRLPPASES